MEHPDRVTELVLRGIFLVREKELQWLYQGLGSITLFLQSRF
jgi:proline iminopeptidase